MNNKQKNFKVKPKKPYDPAQKTPLDNYKDTSDKERRDDEYDLQEALEESGEHQERDQFGRIISDDDDYYQESLGQSQSTERDEYSKLLHEDDEE
mgnify:CR=1 FL=1